MNLGGSLQIQSEACLATRKLSSGRRWRQYALVKRRSTSTRLYGLVLKKTVEEKPFSAVAQCC
jgi:hypothetical protein